MGLVALSLSTADALAELQRFEQEVVLFVGHHVNVDTRSIWRG